MPPAQTGMGRAARVESESDSIISGAVAKVLLVCGITIPTAEAPVLGNVQTSPWGTERITPVVPDVAVRQLSMAVTAACHPEHDEAKGREIGLASLKQVVGMVPCVTLLEPSVSCRETGCRLSPGEPTTHVFDTGPQVFPVQSSSSSSTQVVFSCG